MKTKHELLRSLPKVDECLIALNDYIVQQNVPVRLAKKVVQETINRVRMALLEADDSAQVGFVYDWQQAFISEIESCMQPHLRRVINATGVVVHTNLGRSLLSEASVKQLALAACSYSNLEFDLETGKRGSRYQLVEDIICDLTGAEAALVVNNNAAAVLIALETMAKDREVIVSRGELVEIGGSFRIPDVMAKSGARLVEVGATNRTHLYDYERAIGEETALLLRVHNSNFRMIGFTSKVSTEDLVALGKRRGVSVLEDLGSGSLIDLTSFGLPAEPTVQEVIAAGVDVVTFSGDKLLGGPQAGIIAGKKESVDAIKRNPLNRAMRIDKFTLAALECTLRAYYDVERARHEVPTLRMIGESAVVIKRRARRFMSRIGKRLDGHCSLRLTPVVSRVGGGALPEYGLESWAVALSPATVSVSKLEKDFRDLPVPLIGRIEQDRFLMDFRTIQDTEVKELADLLVHYFLAIA